MHMFNLTLQPSSTCLTSSYTSIYSNRVKSLKAKIDKKLWSHDHPRPEGTWHINDNEDLLKYNHHDQHYNNNYYYYYHYHYYWCID